MMTMCLMLPLRTREARLQSTLSAPLTSRCAPQLPIILGNTWLLHQQAAAVAAHTCLCICQSTLILRGRAAVVLLLCNICCYSFRSPVIHMLTCRLGFRLRIMHDPDPTAWSVLYHLALPDAFITAATTIVLCMLCRSTACLCEPRVSCCWRTHS